MERPNPLNIGFNNIVQNLREGADHNERLLWQKGSIELAFKGNIGKEIAELYYEGLGKLILIRTPQISRNSLETVVDKAAAYSGLLLGISLTDNNTPPYDPKVALIIPNATGYDLAIATPLQSDAVDIKVRDKRNKLNTEKFISTWAPNEQPFVYTGSWDQNNPDRPYETLVNHGHRLFMQIVNLEPDSSKDKVKNEAVELARDLKKEREYIQQMWGWGWGDAA